MWARLVTFFGLLYRIINDAERNRVEVVALRDRVAELESTIERMTVQFDRFTDNERHEREKAALRLQLELARHTRHLASPPRAQEEPRAQ